MNKQWVNQGKLERGARGWNRIRLIRALALGDKTQQQLADEFGVSKGALSKFKTRHQQDIADMMLTLEDEMAGIWVAKKTARLAEYQQDIEDLNEVLQAGRELGSDEDDEPIAPDYGAVLNAKHRALRAVADELGQIPNKVTLQATVVAKHELVGVDVDEL